VESRAGFSTIVRENGLRTVTVTGDLAEDDPARATEVQRALVEEILPQISEDYGLGFRLSGQAADEREFLGGATVALGLCLLGIYLTLAWIFAHWTRPLVVMSVIPFGLIGAIWGHWVWEMPMSLFSIVGLIGMAGIIVNDSIVLVSTADEYAEKRGLHAAIVDAVSDRFRPVLLTTLTTVLGLAPLLYEGSSQAEFLKPTVITLVFGLGFGMVLVLLVVPAIMVVQHDISRAFASLRRGVKRGPKGIRTILGLAVAGTLAVALLLPFRMAVTGTLPEWLAALAPDLALSSPGLVAVAAFVLVGVVLWLLAVLAAAVSVRSAGR
jgi:multidrug efflux pump subunit AcrB